MIPIRYKFIAARHALDLTQTELGERVGLSKQMVSALERGQCGTTVDKWDVIAATLKISQREARELSQNKDTDDIA